MTNRFGIEKVSGRAKVTRTWKVYTTYRDFAKASGYPDAAVELADGEDKWDRASDLKGKFVNILAKGKHVSYSDILYVVESAEGERFIIGEKGLDNIEINADVRGSSKFIEKLAAELIRQAYAEGYRNGKQDAEIRSDVNPFNCSMETPQAKRDRIVEQAKSDFHGWNVSTVEYVVNKRKRTIACLIYGPDTGKVVRKGIAKCAPGDCFNVWIGKAIALRRALGLEVPAEYLNVPNPTEVRVGDKIKWTKNYVIIGINDGTYRFRGERDGWVSSYLDYDRETLVSKIIDDSREEESE